MAKMSLSNESFLLPVIKFGATVFRALPFGLSLWIARRVGQAGYYLLPKKRRVVYLNLKTVFAGRKSPSEIRRIARTVFRNFAQSFVEVMCMPKIKVEFRRFLTLEGKENLDDGLTKGKGVIFLAIHSGSWELASMVGSLCDQPYNIVANEQPKAPRLDDLLNEYRRTAGAKVIEPGGSTTRDIIRALQSNEIVTLVLDQGGKDGTVVKFLGKNASMSTGAIRLGLKYGIPICPVWIVRDEKNHNCLTFFPALDLPEGEYTEQTLSTATRQAAEFFEKLLYDHPQEYMWFYKVFKYSNEANVLIVDDGKTGHLRQSQAAAQVLKSALAGHGKSVQERTVRVDFKSFLAAKCFSLYTFLAQAFRFLLREEALRLFLTEECYKALLGYRPDFIVSCGSSGGGVNFFLSRCWQARSICILKPGLVSWERFDLVIAPEHDRPKKPLKTKMALTKAALNLVTPEYLQEHAGLLLNRYSHLKGNTRTKIGLLLGGNTKGVAFNESQVRLLLRQVKDAALHFNADVLVTTSRRTPPAIDALVAKELKNFERCPLCIIANENNVPEAVGGILGLSDLLIVSGESISMVSEAASSGKRTIVFSPSGGYERPSNKYDRFVMGLSEGGFVMACAIKDLSTAITGMMRNKFALKVDDRAAVGKAIEGIL